MPNGRKQFVIQGMDSHLCNQRCDFCYLTIEEDHLKLGKQKSYLSKDGYRTIADKTIEFLREDRSFDDLLVTGGETLISPDAFRIYEEVAKSNQKIRFIIVTNLVHFPQKWEKLLYPLGDRVSISVSLNASCDEVYRRQHRLNPFSKVDANIKKLVKDLRDGRHKMNLSATMVVTSKTVDDILGFYRYCDDTGIEVCTYRFNTDEYTGSSLVHQLTPDGLSIAFEQIKKLKAYRAFFKDRPSIRLNNMDELESFFAFAGEQLSQKKPVAPGSEKAVEELARERREWVMKIQDNPFSKDKIHEVHKACWAVEDILISANGSVGVCCWSDKYFGNLLDGQSLVDLIASEDRQTYVKNAYCGRMEGCKESCGTLQTIRV